MVDSLKVYFRKLIFMEKIMNFKFKDITNKTNDQVLKGLILKVKNESQKRDISFSDVRPHLLDLLNYDKKIFDDVIFLVLNNKYR